MVERIYPVSRDGVDFEVRAQNPEDAARMAAEADLSTTPRIISRNGSTRVFERPNGQRYVVSPGFSSMDPAAVEKAMAGTSAGDISRSSIDQSLIEENLGAARATQVARGVPFVGSMVDEAMGALRGPNAMAGTRALAGAMERERPGETMALNLAGGVAAPALAAGLLTAAVPTAIPAAYTAAVGTGTRGAQALRGLLAGGIGGGVEGGIYGAGEGQTPDERVSQAQSGAGFGTIAGGAFGAASPYVAQGASNVMDMVRRSDVAQIASIFGISPNAARVIKNTFQMGGDINEAISRVEMAGAEGMVGDAGIAAQALLDATGASSPAGAQAVRGPLDERMTRVNEQLDTGMTGLLGQPAEGPVTAINDIMRRSGPERTARYDAAYSTPIDYADPTGRQIEAIVTQRIEPDILNQAIQQANAEMRDRGMTNQQIMAQIGPDGSMQFVEMPNVRQLDELKKALNALARGAKNTEGLVSVDTPQSLRYQRQANDLRDAIIEATGGPSGTYAQAVKVGGDTIQERNAFELGESLLSPRTRVESVRLELGPNPSQAQIDAAKVGLRTRIDQIVGDVRRIPSDPNIDARQALAVLREAGSDNAREKIRRVLGADADEMLRMLDQAMVAAETRAATSVNSRTAIRQATDEQVRDITAPGVVGQLAQGEPINTAKAVVQAVTGMTNEYTVAQRQRIYQDIARALTQKQGDDAVIALRALDAAMQGQQLTDSQTDQLSRLLAATLFTTAAPATTRALESEYSPQ
jgi:hypothetical protein